MALIQIEPAPICPLCGGRMKLVRPKTGNEWKTFWGCAQFRATGCKGSRKPLYKSEYSEDQLSFLPKPVITWGPE